MKIIIGTTSISKKDSLEKIMRSFVNSESLTVTGFAAKSQVPETPWDKETYDGARNRALHAREEMPDADYAVGVESGLIKRYGHIFEEAWCCIITRDGSEYFGYSSGLTVPDYILKMMDEEQMGHDAVMKLLEDQGSINKDTWANYSGELISRSISLEEAIRNTLIQVFAPDTSFYKKSK